MTHNDKKIASNSGFIDIVASPTAWADSIKPLRKTNVTKNRITEVITNIFSLLFIPRFKLSIRHHFLLPINHDYDFAFYGFGVKV